MTRRPRWLRWAEDLADVVTLLAIMVSAVLLAEIIR